MRSVGQVGRGHQVAHAPAGHRVDLREGVDRHQPVVRVGHRPDADEGVVEGELVVDLVGDEPQAPTDGRSQAASSASSRGNTVPSGFDGLLTRIALVRGVTRRSRSSRRGRKSPSATKRVREHTRPEQVGDHAKVRPGGVWQQYLVPRFEQGAKHQVERLDAPLRDHHLLLAHLVAVAPDDLVRQGFAQLGKPRVGGVAGMASLRGLVGSFDDVFEGVGKSGSPTSRWMASGSSQARSMTSRMRETGHGAGDRRGKRQLVAGCGLLGTQWPSSSICRRASGYSKTAHRAFLRNPSMCDTHATMSQGISGGGFA